MFLKYLKKYWYLCLLTSVMVILETVVDLLQPSMMADIVDKGVLLQDMPIIIRLGIRMIIIVLFGGVTGIFGSIFGNMAGQSVGRDLRRDLFSKTMHLSFEQSDTFTTGSLVNRVSDDVTRIQDSVKVAFRGIVRYAFMLAGGIFMLFRLSAPFALIALCALPFLAFFVIFFLSRSSKMFATVQKKLDRVSNIMQEDVHGARVIKAFVREEKEASRFEEANASLFLGNLKVQSFLAFLNPLMNIVLNLCVAAIILIGGYDVNRGGSTTPGQVMAGITYFAIILTGASVLGNLSQTFIRAGASWNRIKEVLTCEPSVKDGTSHTAAGISDQDTNAVEFRNVTFSYPGSPANALEDISFSVKKGQTLGIIGPTGCGKTTLADLIPRFYDADKGEVLVDGTDVKDMTLEELRSKISYVLQNNELYSRSIRENISWGSPCASMDDIAAAARDAQAAGFIESFPDGYDTLVTEGGHSVSGGQKQRIAIARALLKGSEILIMDDATSALDLKTESMLYKAVNNNYPDLTKIVIAQRIATVMKADAIAVMDGGKIAAYGTHSELMESSPLYREIYDSQLKGSFKEDDAAGFEADDDQAADSGAETAFAARYRQQDKESSAPANNPHVNIGSVRTDNHGIIEKAADSRGTLRRLISYLSDFKGLFAALTLLVVISTGALVAIPALEGSSIDMIHESNMRQLIILVIWLLVMFLINSLSTLFQARISAKLSLLITRRMRSRLFSSIMKLPVKYLDTHSNGDILSRMTNDVENVSSTLSQSLTSFISAVLSIAGTLVVIFISCWQLALITLFTVFLTVFSTKKLSKVMAKEFRKKAKINGQLGGVSEEMITGYRSVAAYNMQGKVIDEFNKCAEELRSVGIRAESLSNGVGPVLDCISNIGFVIVAVFGGLFALNGMITIGVVSAFIVYAKQFIRPVNEVAQIYGSIQTAIAGAERVFSLMDEPQEDHESGSVLGENARDDLLSPKEDHMSGSVLEEGAENRNVAGPSVDATGKMHGEGPSMDAADRAHEAESSMVISGKMHMKEPDVSGRITGAVAFKNVDFSYIEGTQVLYDFSLDIRPGQKIALVGATGSGKTTVVNLLERFYDADKGDITIDGKSIYELNLESLREHLAIVLQDTVLFTGSVRDNICYARPDASDEQMRRAAEISNSDSFIEKLPDGYETTLVRAGANLSQGQRQLLCIARAVLADPAILILDEATSSVDTKTEKQIQDAMANLMRDRTSLIIAHRLSTIQDADIIVVMDAGRIAETGTHEELLARRGLYYSLYMTQFAGGVI